MANEKAGRRSYFTTLRHLMTLLFVEHPLIKAAHPDDAHEYPAGARCTKCAIAECQKTGRRFMLWLSNGVHWSLSRNDPHYDTEVQLGDIELTQ